ncbi:MAG: hypothetical protein GQE15_24745 [Archangiaceae bacterium]|nr:hypothetical protein [Archangiaceae bacterium]
MPFTRVAVALVLFVALEVSAKPKRTKVPRNGVLVLMWGGGKTAADGEKALADFKARIPKSSVTATVLRSDDVTGLKPGFHVAAIGVCPILKGRQLVEQLRIVSKGVYARLVPPQKALEGLACPAITFPNRDFFFFPQGDGEDHEQVFEARTATTQGVLVGALTVTVNTNGEYLTSWFEVSAELQDQKGSAVSSTSISKVMDGRVESFKGEGDALVLTATEYEGACPSARWYEELSVEYRIAVRKGELQVKRREVSREGGLCAPDAEGLTGEQLARKTAAVEQASAACKGKGAKACLEALSIAESEMSSEDEPERQPAGDD